MSTAAAMVDWCRTQLGTHELGGRHDDGNIVHYWDDVHMHWCQGQPWCDAFVSAGFLALGVGVPVFAYCPASEAWYQRQGRLTVAPRPEEIHAGDQLFYSWGAPAPGHTGIALSSIAGAVTAIEGNAQPSLAGDQSNGGGVYERTRPLSQIRSVGHPPYELAAPPAPPPVRTLTLFGATHVIVPVTVTTDNNGNGWVPPLQNVDVTKVAAATVQGSAPDRDHGYWPGSAHWQDNGGHPLVSVTGAQPNSRVTVFLAVGT